MTIAENSGRSIAPSRVNLHLFLFGGTMFVSAALVFALEPMIAKMILPLLGGSPAVWNTSMMFFQIALLAGYAYAHGLQRLVPPRAQVITHLSLVAVSGLVLPIAINPALGAPPAGNPIGWLLGVLTLSIGAPFAVLSATAPLLQAWYARLQRDEARPRNPYILYGASNLGSMLALLAYPLLIEPSLALSRQSMTWTALYELFFLLIAAVGVMVWRTGGGAHQAVHGLRAHHIDWRRRLGWMMLAAIPSSLMLGTSTYIANDVASVPLFWVIPLALYLLTFIIAFQEKPILSRERALRWQVIFAVLAGIALCVTSIVLMLGLLIFLGALFFGALICHQALAASRPHETRLTEFYLLVSAGGVLGGVFNSLLAPMLFHTVLEFPLMLVLACLARPWNGGKASSRDWLIAGAGIAAAFATAFVPAGQIVKAGYGIAALAIFAGAAAALVHRRTFLFTAVIAALAVQGAFISFHKNANLAIIRSFFGVSRVEALTDPKLGPLHVLWHGNTIHGSQALSPALSCVPGMYYTPQTPIGETVLNLRRRNPALNIGVVGLGTGTLSAYTRAADRLRYFEIDPAVVRIARDPKYFTYLSQCAKGKVDTVVGDARMTMDKEPAGTFDAVILDAFSADNIPTHLLTREAFALYFRALKPDGVVLLHISNRNLSLEAPVAATAKAAGVQARIRIFNAPDPKDEFPVTGTEVALLSKSEKTLEALTTTPGWRTPQDRNARAWTDEYTNIVGALYDRVIQHLP